MKGQDWYRADEVAQGYEDKRFSGGGRLIDERERAAVREALGPVDGLDVLEIACGTGRFTAMLSEEGADAVGVDISRPMLEQGLAQARAGAEKGGRLELIQGDAARLPFPDDTFDAVFAIRFLHLADEAAPFLREIKRVARDRVLFDTFNARTLRSPYTWLLPMGSHLYTEDEVRDLLDEVGLVLEDARHDFVVPYGIYRGIPESVAEPLRNLDSAVMDTTLGEHLASVSYWTATVP